MSQTAEYVKYSEEKGEHIERVVEIYESADAVRGHNPKKQLEDINIETQQTGMHNFCETPDIIKEQKCIQQMEDTKTNQIPKQNTGGGTAWSRCYRVTIVCVLLLCFLVLSAVTVLWIKFNTLTTENSQLQTRYNTLAIQREQLQTSYNNLTIERDQLQTSYNNLTRERDQLQEERDGCLKTLCNSYKRCFRFGSNFYYISNETKNWDDSRQDCRNKGADLVIINSTAKQEFIIKQLNDSTAWIGLSDSAKEGEWKWVDSTQLNTAYWNQGEPNNAGNEDCAVIFSSSNTNAWNDERCSNVRNWICEKRVFQ